ncbi:DUF6121 family protein [Agromyces mangrovi Wang et al. 2018]|uniref:DUF6121 family protein n=1 Tax=Agromyces mangrovi TaxID=1858653 RepID=UPI0025740346|nr:DUF6121 family protein [Agromyces mangrovi]BDZ63894.1 hypothetical protein GCM10025877_08320 [Agromyces mangrovi]
MDADQRNYARALAPFATATYLAALVCAFGFLALLFGGDPITLPDAGLLLGPAMVGVAVLVLLAMLLFAVPGRRFRDQAASTWFGIWTGVAAWAGYVLTGVIAYGGTVDSLDFAVTLVLSPFTSIVALFAAAVTWADIALVRRRGRSAGPPRWPWEERT